MSHFRTLFLDLKFAPHIGGTATMFKHRARLYNPENIIVLTRIHEKSVEFDKTVNYKIIRKPFKVKGLKGFEWISSSFLLILESLKLIFKQKVTFIEAARPFPEGVAALMLKFITGKKTVINFHGEDIAVMSNYRVEKIVLKIMTRFSNVLLCNSSFTSNLLNRLFSGCKEKTEIVYPGYDPVPKGNLDHTKIDSFRNSYAGNPVLVTVSRIAERKGHDMVIRVLPALLKEFPSLIYVIAGSIDKEEGEGAINRLKKIAAELGVTEHIKFIMNFSDEERPYILAASDLFIMPNRTLASGEVEGYGIVFLEASRLGIPVIGGRSGGVVDVIKNNENGILVDGNSEKEITDALFSILKNDEFKKKLGSNGIQFSLNMDYISSFNKYFNIIDSVDSCKKTRHQ